MPNAPKRPTYSRALRGSFYQRRLAPRAVLDEALQRNRKRGGNIDTSPFTTRAEADEANTKPPPT